MAIIVSEFFGIIGFDVYPPETMSELIPYLLTIFVGLVLVVAVFKVIGTLASTLLNWRWVN